jgi:dihydropteroate synthase
VSDQATLVTTRTVGHARPRIMGVLNITPDSFSDGGQFERIDLAIEHAAELMAAGAQLIDVGGESTKPGAARPSVEHEQARVLPVIEALVQREIPVSVDTMNASTALAAAELGVVLINDVSGGLADAAMARVVAETGLPYIAMHWRGHSATMQQKAEYGNVVLDVLSELTKRVESLRANGVRDDRIILDPGLGFSKSAEHNWQLLANLPALGSIGFPILIGASRKRFLATMLPPDAPITNRDVPTATISALAAQAGVWGVRVHDVAGTRAALDVWEAMQP